MSWYELHPKIKAALLALGLAEAATVAAWWDGKLTVHQTIGAAVAAAWPVLVGYLKGS